MNGIHNDDPVGAITAATIIHTEREIIAAEALAFELLGLGKNHPAKMIAGLGIAGYEQLLISLSGDTEKFAVLDHAIKDMNNTGKRLLLRTTKIPGTSPVLYHLQIMQQSMDIPLLESEIKKLRQEKQVLYREIHHRVKNNMQIILSLLKLQASGPSGKAAEEELMKSRNRIQSMALVYEHAFNSGNIRAVDMREYSEWLLRYLFRSFGINRENISYSVAMNGLSLPIDIAVNCGLIMNELVTNLIRRTFNKPGHIEICGISNKDKSVHIMISNNNEGVPENISFEFSKTLEFQIVNLLVEQMNGKIEEKMANGSGFVIIFTPQENM